MPTTFEENVICPYCGNEVYEFYEIEGWDGELQDDGDEQIVICKNGREK